MVGVFGRDGRAGPDGEDAVFTDQPSMYPSKVAALICLVVTTTCACGPSAADGGSATSSSSSGGAMIDAGEPGDGSSDAGAGATDAGADSGGLRACNAITQAGGFVAARSDPGAPPTPAGGTTNDGLYVLDSIVLYGVTQAFDYKSKSTLQATGLTVNVVEDTGSGDVRKTGTGVVSGATLTLTETCAFPARTLRVERADFTATSDRIELFGDVSGRTLVQTFRKR